MSVRALRLLTAAVASTAILAAVTGCGSADSKTSAHSTSIETSTGSGLAAEAAGFLKPPAQIPVSTPVSKPIKSGLTVAFIHSGVLPSQTTLKGFSAAAAVLGWTVRASTYDQTNPATILTAIDSALAEHPDAIVLSALQTAQYATEIPKAIAAGIPLIPYAVSDPPQKGVYPVAKTDVRSTYAAQILGKTLVADAAKAGATPHVVQLTVSAFKVVLGYEDDGIKATLAKYCPGCKQDLLDISLPNVFNGQYTQQVVSYLQSHPDVKYVISDSGQLADGLPAALSGAGLSGITIYGFTPGPAQTKALQGGAKGAWVAQPYTVTGWEVADQVARIVVGDPTNLWDHEAMSYIVSAANANQPPASESTPVGPDFPVGYEQQFKKLWNK
jgi:ABC-type sugar transport system substrate-binding protein